MTLAVSLCHELTASFLEQLAAQRLRAAGADAEAGAAARAGDPAMLRWLSQAEEAVSGRAPPCAHGVPTRKKGPFELHPEHAVKPRVVSPVPMGKPRGGLTGVRKKGSSCRAAELERRKEKRKKRRSLEELQGVFEEHRGGRAVAATAVASTKNDGAIDSLGTSCDGEMDHIRKTSSSGQPRDHPLRSEPLTL
jgi:hypothetical protein